MAHPSDDFLHLQSTESKPLVEKVSIQVQQAADEDLNVLQPKMDDAPSASVQAAIADPLSVNQYFTLVSRPADGADGADEDPEITEATQDEEEKDDQKYSEKIPEK